MYDYFHRKLLKRGFAMTDETRVQVLNEEGRKAQSQSFRWLFRSGEDGLPVLILYGYSPARSGSQTKEFLECYSGYLETDGYQGVQKPARDQTLFLLGPYPPVFYRCRSERKAV